LDSWLGISYRKLALFRVGEFPPIQPLITGCLSCCFSACWPSLFSVIFYRTKSYTWPCGSATCSYRPREWTQSGLPGYTWRRYESKATVSTPSSWGSTDLSGQ